MEQLDRDRALQDFVTRAPNFAHPPGSDLFFQEVPAGQEAFHHEHGSVDVKVPTAQTPETTSGSVVINTRPLSRALHLGALLLLFYPLFDCPLRRFRRPTRARRGPQGVG